MAALGSEKRLTKTSDESDNANVLVSRQGELGGFLLASTVNFKDSSYRKYEIRRVSLHKCICISCTRGEIPCTFRESSCC